MRRKGGEIRFSAFEKEKETKFLLGRGLAVEGDEKGRRVLG